MELPQYIQKLNPQAAIMSDRVPDAQLTGLDNLKHTLDSFIDSTKDYLDETSLNHAKKDYEVWLNEEKVRFAQETTLENFETESQAFNQRATEKIDECLVKNGVSWSRRKKASSQMQAAYVPDNLKYSIGVGEGIKAKAFESDEINYSNDLANRVTSATAAQLTGENGHFFLSSMLNDVDSYVARMISSGYIPASAREFILTKKKMEVTNLFFGRLLKENPAAAYNFVTRNSNQVLIEQANIFETHGNTSKYQRYYSKTQDKFKFYQTEIEALSEQDKLRLGIKPITINGEKSYNSYVYNLGALYDEAHAQGIDFAQAIQNPELLAKFTTPYSPYFSKSSIYCDSTNMNVAGHWQNGQFIPANLTKGSKYYDKDLAYLSLNVINFVQDGHSTYSIAAQKEQKAADLATAKKLNSLEKALAADNIPGDTPTTIVQPTSHKDRNIFAEVNNQTEGSTKKPIKRGLDPYKNAPMPTTFLTKSEIKALIIREAKALNVPEEAALALFERESNFNPRARGLSGEYSLGQLMPDTAKALGVTNPWDSLQNVRASLKYFKQALDSAGGDPVLAYAGYNGGPRAIGWYRHNKGSAQLRNNVAGYKKIYLRYKNGQNTSK